STDPREETRALSATRARQLIGLPDGESVIGYRDRAILKTFLWSGIRLGTACRLKVSDSHQDGDEATLRLHAKGDKRRTIGLHFHAARLADQIYPRLLLPPRVTSNNSCQLVIQFHPNYSANGHELTSWRTFHD